MRRAVAGLVLAIVLAGAPAAGADVYDDNPAAASRGPGDMVVIARGADGAIYERHVAGGAWTPWASLGGQTSSGPGLAAYGPEMHAFVAGTSGAAYENVLRDGHWSGWAGIGGSITSAPSAIARRGTTYLDVAARGTDNAAYLRTFQPGAGWSAWSSLGGNLTAGPALNSQDPLVLNVWARATDGQLVQKAWTGAAWGDFAPLGGSILGAPAVVSRTENHVDVFVRGSNRALYQRYWHGGTGWSDWALVDPTPIDSTPAVASDTADHLAFFARSGSNILVKQWRGATGWTRWVNWGPVAPPPPPAAPLPDGKVTLTTGVRCTPPGGRLKVSLKIRKRPGVARPRIRKVVFFVKRGPRRADRRRPYVRHLRLNRPPGASGRVYARAVYKRKGSKRLHRKTVSKRFVMCG